MTKGGKREGAGRKKSLNPKKSKIEAYLTKKQKDILLEFQAIKGERMSFLIINALEKTYNISLRESL